MSRIRWRRDFLIPLTFLLTLGFLAFALIQIDRQYYQYEKYTIILDNPKKYIPFDRTEIKNLTSEALTSEPGSVQRERALARLRIAVERLLESDSPYIAFQLREGEEHGHPLLDVRVEKLRRFNNWSNSLFLKDFQRAIDEIFYLEPMPGKPGSESERRPLGRFVLRYTTPQNFPEIEAVTNKWRWRCVFITIGFLAFYGAVLKGMLLPMRRVIACLEHIEGAAPEILHRPGSLLERAYNNLARDSCLTKFASRLRDRIASDPSLEPRRLLEQIPRDLEVYFGFRNVMFFTLRADEGGAVWIVERSFGQPDAKVLAPGDPAPGEFLRRKIAAMPPAERTAIRAGFEGTFTSGRGQALTVFAYFVDYREDPETVTLLVFFPEEPGAGGVSPWWRDTYRQVAEQTRVTLDSLSAQRRLILQEKSKANISLSRNLGHDLTNIIATSKLDLLTLQRFLSLKPEDWAHSRGKEEIFRASLAAVLNTTRFLQEIVNIYRSFSYLSRPKFERVDPRELTREVVELFRLSLSRAIEVEMDMADGAPECLMEPRLVKLALFNLLTNAADAIKLKTSGDTEQAGRIRVRVRPEPETGEVVIAVADNGTGILDAEGKPLPDGELEQIFRLGYTTREKEHGEGLGLNWVLTIISDFHGGRVVPRNRPEGGAEMAIFLRVEGPRESPRAPLSSAEPPSAAAELDEANSTAPPPPARPATPPPQA